MCLIQIPSEDIHTAHDRYFRNAFSEKSVVKEVLQKHMPAHLAGRIDFDTVKRCHDSYIDKTLYEQITDVLYECTIDDTECYLYFLFEHLSSPRRFVAISLLKCLCGIWQDYITNNTCKKVPAVIPIVIYNGEKPYPFSTKLLDLTAAPGGAN